MEIHFCRIFRLFAVANAIYLWYFVPYIANSCVCVCVLREIVAGAPHIKLFLYLPNFIRNSHAHTTYEYCNILFACEHINCVYFRFSHWYWLHMVAVTLIRVCRAATIYAPSMALAYAVEIDDELNWIEFRWVVKLICLSNGRINV